jgi:hypothetical protein
MPVRIAGSALHIMAANVGEVDGMREGAAGESGRKAMVLETLVGGGVVDESSRTVLEGPARRGVWRISICRSRDSGARERPHWIAKIARATRNFFHPS